MAGTVLLQSAERLHVWVASGAVEVVVEVASARHDEPEAVKPERQPVRQGGERQLAV